MRRGNSTVPEDQQLNSPEQQRLSRGKKKQSIRYYSVQHCPSCGNPVKRQGLCIQCSSTPSKIGRIGL